ncbi:hypothetical protein KC319_g65 [Hortaea werneckii]|nr:hypothetical protein KC319_g65 [Hortaea werneckii]
MPGAEVMEVCCELDDDANRMTAAESGIAGNTSAMPWAASHRRDGHEHQIAANVSHSQVSWIAVFAMVSVGSEAPDSPSPYGPPHRIGGLNEAHLTRSCQEHCAYYVAAALRVLSSRKLIGAGVGCESTNADWLIEYAAMAKRPDNATDKEQRDKRCLLRAYESCIEPFSGKAQAEIGRPQKHSEAGCARSVILRGRLGCAWWARTGAIHRSCAAVHTLPAVALQWPVARIWSGSRVFTDKSEETVTYHAREKAEAAMRSRRCQLSIGMNAATRLLHALDAVENPGYTPASASVRPAQRRVRVEPDYSRSLPRFKHGHTSSTLDALDVSELLLHALYATSIQRDQKTYHWEATRAGLRTGQPFAVVSCSTGSATARSVQHLFVVKTSQMPIPTESAAGLTQ